MNKSAKKIKNLEGKSVIYPMNYGFPIYLFTPNNFSEIIIELTGH